MIANMKRREFITLLGGAGAIEAIMAGAQTEGPQEVCEAAESCA